MMHKALFLLLLVLVGALVPFHKASAVTWQEAYSNCLSDLAYVKSRGNSGLTGACQKDSSLPKFNFSWDPANAQQYPNGVSCYSYSYPVGMPYPCGYSGSNPPVCTPNRIYAGAALSSVHSWDDGTECDDSGCMVGTFLGGSMNADRYETGAYCPYDSSSKPPDAPPPPQQASSPPACNADGSCTSCAGTTCASTGVPPPPAPPPPASAASSGNHTTNYNNSTTNNYSSQTTFSGGGAASGSSSGVVQSGTSTTTGSGTSDSQGKCDSGACDVGEADGQLGGLYQHSTDTPSSMFTQFVAEVKGAPVIAAVSGFFTVQAGGSCPSWHIPGNQYWGANGFDFSFFCTSDFLAIFELAGWLVLAGAAFCAFRIALY